MTIKQMVREQADLVVLVDRRINMFDVITYVRNKYESVTGKTAAAVLKFIDTLDKMTAKQRKSSKVYLNRKEITVETASNITMVCEALNIRWEYCDMLPNGVFATVLDERNLPGKENRR